MIFIWKKKNGSCDVMAWQLLLFIPGFYAIFT